MMLNKLRKQALDKWYLHVCEEIQKESFKFEGSVIPFGAGLATGVIAKNFANLQKAVDQDEWIEVKTRPSTYDEKQRYQDIIWMYDCELPDDGQEVLISTKYCTIEKTIYTSQLMLYLHNIPCELLIL